VVFAVWLFVSWFFWFFSFVCCYNLVSSSAFPDRDAFLHHCIDFIPFLDFCAVILILFSIVFSTVVVLVR